MQQFLQLVCCLFPNHICTTELSVAKVCSNKPNRTHSRSNWTNPFQTQCIPKKPKQSRAKTCAPQWPIYQRWSRAPNQGVAPSIVSTPVTVYLYHWKNISENVCIIESMFWNMVNNSSSIEAAEVQKKSNISFQSENPNPIFSFIWATKYVWQLNIFGNKIFLATKYFCRLNIFTWQAIAPPILWPQTRSLFLPPA